MRKLMLRAVPQETETLPEGVASSIEIELKPGERAKFLVFKSDDSSVKHFHMVATALKNLLESDGVRIVPICIGTGEDFEVLEEVVLPPLSVWPSQMCAADGCRVMYSGSGTLPRFCPAHDSQNP